MQYSVQYRYNLARLYEKTFNDMRSTQAANGMIPTIAPELVEFEGGFKDTPEWGSTFVISPWYIYQWYGDTRPIETYYPDMQRYIDYLSSKADNHIIAYGLGKSGRIATDLQWRNGNGYLLLRRHPDGENGKPFREAGRCTQVPGTGGPDQTSLQPDFLELVHPDLRPQQPGGKRRRTLHGTDDSGKQAAGIR